MKKLSRQQLKKIINESIFLEHRIEPVNPMGNISDEDMRKSLDDIIASGEESYAYDLATAAQDEDAISRYEGEDYLADKLDFNISTLFGKIMSVATPEQKLAIEKALSLDEGELIFGMDEDYSRCFLRKEKLRGVIHLHEVIDAIELEKIAASTMLGRQPRSIQNAYGHLVKYHQDNKVDLVAEVCLALIALSNGTVVGRDYYKPLIAGEEKRYNDLIESGKLKIVNYVY